MPRSPFQGTYQPGIRPTVVMSPDAIVYINGESDIIGCGKCKRRFDWNRYVTSIQTDLNIDSPPGSATINLSIPRHSVDEFYFDGNPLITPMMEVEIFAKGAFTLEGLPQYYPIFWGLVTEVSNSYSGGEHTFSINCADILKWWELCMMNVNPSFTGVKGQGGTSIFGNVFFGMNPYDVIWTLAQQSFGDVVVGTGSLTSLVNEKNPSFQNTFKSALGDIMQYWNQRFSKIRSNLMLYGTSGTAVRGDAIQAAYQNGKPRFGKPFASQLVRQANGNATAQMDFDPTDPSVTAFRTQFGQAGQVNFWQTEYQTKLEMANLCKEAIGFEFYMDSTGDIVFKPPFYNLDVLSNKPISWIQDIDIINWDFSDSEAEVVTQIQLQGNYGGNIDYGLSEEVTPYTSVTDYHLLRKYGWRSRTYNSEFMGSTQLMFYVGLDLLDRFNSKRFRGTVTIPMRPELRMGFPIYVAPLDQIWYVQGISHNLTYGGQATTTLTLTAKRGKFIAPRGIGSLQLTSYKGAKDTAGRTLLEGEAARLTARQLSAGGRFKADVGDAAQIPAVNATSQTVGGVDPYEPLILRHPKTGRIVGYPNVVMAYTRPFAATPDQLAKLQGQKVKTDPRVAQSKVKEANQAAQDQLDGIRRTLTNTASDDLRDKHLNNRYSYGINSAGVYTYLHDQSKVVLEMLLLPSSNITFNQTEVTFSGKSGMIRPVSDERGFEVIGHHRYGRGVALRDGSLVVTLGGNNTPANVGTQLALSGGLYESLQAQSQGLTTLSTGYASPADAVTRLTPGDLQTAGVINPETKKPEYTNTGTNFVSTAPLNSPEREGADSPPNVEASQLSRALTLTEMSVRAGLASGTAADSNCECVTGRADLAFINVGYQVQILKPTSPETNFQAEAQGLLTQARAAAAADPRVAVLGEITEDEAFRQEVQRLRASASVDLQQALDNAQQGSLSDAVSATTGPVLDGSDTLSRVDRFLASLYRALDEPHQQYERELRGELIQVTTRTPEQVRFEPAPDEVSPFSPPYSVPSRAAGGDPSAIAAQGKISLNQASTVWSSFGTKLKSGAEKARLQGEINRSKSHITALEATKQRLQAAMASGGVVVGVGGTPEQRLVAIQADIDKEIQSISNNQTKLGQITQETSA